MVLTCIDPGPTSGYSKFNISEAGEITLVDCGECPDVVSVSNIVCGSDVVTYERYFVSRPLQDLCAAEVVGILKHLQAECSYKLIRQEPTILKFVDARYFKKQQLKLPAKSIHARDSFRHGIFYIGQTMRNKTVEEFLKCYLIQKKLPTQKAMI